MYKVIEFSAAALTVIKINNRNIYRFKIPITSFSLQSPSVAIAGVSINRFNALTLVALVVFVFMCHSGWGDMVESYFSR